MDFDLKLLLVMLALPWTRINGDDDIRQYNMEEHCGEDISTILSWMHQLKLELTVDRMSDWICETRIRSWYSYPSIMFYFDDLDLDCDDGYLQFFTGRTGFNRVQGLELDICGDDTPRDIFIVPQMMMRIKYVSKREQYLAEVMSLIVTSYTKGECPYGSYKCDNARCIDEDITCTGHNPCGDDSDCKQTVSRLSSAAVAGVVIGSLGILFILASIVVWLCCCRKGKFKAAGTVQRPPCVIYTAQQSRYNHDCYGVTSTSIQNPSYHSQGTAPAAPTAPANFTAGQQPMYSPNVSLPAYKAEVEESPPPYTDLYGDVDCPGEAAANSEPAPVNYDNNKDKVPTKADNDNAKHIYESVGQSSGDQPYDNVQKTP